MSSSSRSLLRRLRVLRARRARPRRRVPSWLLALVVLAGVSVLVGRRYVAQSLDVAGLAKRQIIPALEKQLGQKIEVGQVETDYRARVVLHNLVIGRNAKSPLGAIAKVPRATLDLDLFSLVLGRSDAASALRRITLERPALFLRRDAQGRINLLQNIKSSNGPQPKLNLQIVATNGRLYVQDEQTLSARNLPLTLDAREVTLHATLQSPVANGVAPLRFALSAPRALAPLEKTQLSQVSVQGAATLDGKRSELQIATASAPAATLLSYLIPRGQLVAQSGTLRARVQLAVSNGALRWRADARLQKLSASIPTLRDPRTRAPIAFEASGPLSLDARAIRFENLQARVPALKSAFALSGAATLNGQKLSVRVQSQALDTTSLLAFARSTFPASASLLNARSGLARADVRVSRDAQSLGIAGTLVTPNAMWRGNRAQGEFAASSVQSDFALSYVGSQLRASSVARLGAPRWNNAGAQGRANRAQIAFQFQNGPQTRYSVDATLPAFSGRFAPGTTPNVTATNAQAGTLRVLMSGDARGNIARFQSVQARVDAGARGALSAQTASGALSWRGAKLGASEVELANWRAFAPQFGTARGQSGRVQLRAFDPTQLAGTIRVTGADLSGLRATTQLRKNGVRDFGLLDANASFAHFDAARPQRAVARGRFRLAYLRADANALGRISARNINGEASYANAHLRLANARAQTSFGPIIVQADLPISSSGASGLSAPRFSLLLPQARLSPTLLATLLPQTRALRTNGDVIGRLQIAPVNVKNGNAVATRFDLTLPRATFPARDSAGRALALLTSGATLRGRGTLFLGANANTNDTTAKEIARAATRFVGTGVFAAPQLSVQNGAFALPGALTVPAWLRGAQVNGARLTWNINTSANNLRAGGDWTFASVSAPVPALTASTSSASPASRVALAMRRVRLQNGRGAWQFAPGAFAVPRFKASALGGTVAGRFALRNGAPTGELLAQNLNTSAVAQLANAPLTGGRFWARLQLPAATTQAARAATPPASLPATIVQARLYNAVMRVNGRALPLDSARAEFSLDLQNLTRLSLRDFQAWSRGARVQASGELMPRDGNMTLALQTDVSGVRARDAMLLAGMSADALRDASADGALGFSGRVSGTLARPSANGRLSVQLAHAYGASVPKAGANAQVSLTAHGPRVRLEDISAQVASVNGESRASGNLALDVPGNAWRVQLTAENVSAERAGRVAQTRMKGRAFPVAGTLNGRLDVRGTFGSPQQFALLPTTGSIKVDSGPLSFRGHDIGALHADLLVRNNVAFARRLELRAGDETATPPDTASAIHQNEAFADENAPLKANESASQVQVSKSDSTPDSTLTTTSNNAAFVRVTGALPLSMDAPTLNAQLQAQGGRASFLVSALTELRDFLRAGENNAQLKEPTRANATIPRDDERDPILRALNGAVNAAIALPGLEGEASARALLTGSWRAPVADVSELRITNARARAPQGDLQNLPSLDASFVYDGANGGALTFRRADFRLPSGDADDPDDDTLLRVSPGAALVPGGSVKLDARVLNANLSLLAPWVPALRDASGASLLSGDLQQFTFSLSGAPFDPQVTGFIQASNLKYRDYTLERARLSRFEISNGQFRVRPGDLTIAKGAFQSSVGSGVIPWDWSLPGPPRNQPLHVELPFGTNDFGALVGVLAPSVVSAQAEEFGGIVRVDGTLDAPQLSGKLKVRGGTLRAVGRVLPLNTQLTDVSGSVTFSGDTVQIDADDPLKGRLVPTIVEKTRVPDRQRAPVIVPVALAATATANPQLSTIAGAWQLRGRVQLDTSELLRPLVAIANSRYDLAFTLRDGSVLTPSMDAKNAAIREATLAVLWRTGAGLASEQQRVSWMMSARGARGGRENGGRVFSTGALQLRDNFTQGLDEIGRGDVQNADANALRALPVWNAFPADERDNLTPRVSLRGLHLSSRDMGSGDVDGVLNLDNGQVRAPQLPRALPNGNVRPIALRALPLPLPSQQQINNAGTPVRLSGTLVLSRARIMGAGAGAGASALQLPSVPALDVRLQLGESVEFSTATLRAPLAGELALVGTPRAFSLSGTVQTRGGQVRFPGANARIVAGTLEISAARDPETGLLRARAVVDATARGRAGRYSLEIALRGPLSTDEATNSNAAPLSVTVTTDPPLSQDEAFSRLLGILPPGIGDRGDRESEAYARAVVSLISAPIFSGLERSLEQAFGLSSISVDYRLNEPLAVEFGKAIGSRVYVSYRREFSGNRPGERTPYTARVEVRIKGGVQIGAQTDERERRQITIQKTIRF